MPRDRFFNIKMLKGSISLPQDIYSGRTEGAKSLPEETETPLLDIYEDPEAIIIEADLPGIKPDEVSVHLSNNSVIIKGRRGGRAEEDTTGHYLRMERCIEDFRRIIPLPISVDPHRSEANYRHGILILRFPRIKERRNRAIKIQIK